MTRNSARRLLLVASTLFFSSLLPSPALAQTVSFEPALTFNVGASPQVVAVGDFNGDGRQDLAVANSGSNTVSVLLGNGDGTFQPAQDFPVGRGPTSVAVGDFNRDGILDLVTTNLGSFAVPNNTVSVLLGNGNGTFQLARDFLVGSNPNFIAVGDFNGDGLQDLAVANFGSNAPDATTVSVLLGNGDGTFQVAGTFNAQRGPLWVAVGDFNGDGRQDLAVANFGSTTVSVLLGNGDGTFQAAQNVAAAQGPASVAVGDFNGDGRQDLAVTIFGDGTAATVMVLLGNGDGTFRAPLSFGVGRGPVSSSVGDFNGDGVQDLAVSNWDGNTGTIVSVLVGNGDGTFQAAQNVVAGRGVLFAAVADLNGDGRLDLATANYAAGTVSVLINNTGPAPNPRFTLSVTRQGTGSGTVTSSPPGIDCGATCSASYESGTMVTLTATPAPGSTFTGWSGGGCVGTGTCTVTTTAATTVTATFDPQSQGFTLTVSRTGIGSGTVTSSPPGIDCGTSCSATYPSGTAVALTATPAPGSTFAGWSGGGCVGTGTCTVTTTAATTVTATFDLERFPLTVNRAGGGSVTSSPQGIDCGAICSACYDSGTVVTLTATPAFGFIFGDWTGCDTVSGTTCSVTMSAARSVTASFNLPSFTLTVDRTGIGSGTVTSSPAGINCGATCSASYTSGTVVTLTATPALGSVFAGWSGACSNLIGTCTVTMTADTAVTATFLGIPLF